MTINDIKPGPQEHELFDNDNDDSNVSDNSFEFDDDRYNKEIKEEIRLDNAYGIGDNKVQGV